MMIYAQTWTPADWLSLTNLGSLAFVTILYFWHVQPRWQKSIENSVPKDTHERLLKEAHVECHVKIEEHAKAFLESLETHKEHNRELIGLLVKEFIEAIKVVDGKLESCRGGIEKWREEMRTILKEFGEKQS